MTPRGICERMKVVRDSCNFMKEKLKLGHNGRITRTTDNDSPPGPFSDLLMDCSSFISKCFHEVRSQEQPDFRTTGEREYIRNTESFKAEMIPNHLLPPGGKVDLFAIHSRLNVPEHSKVLHEDSRWVTILRDPARQYESLFNFYRLGEAYGLNLTQFRDMPIEKLGALPRKQGKFGRNQVLFDLGYPDNMSVTQLRSAMDRLDKLFDLVMISEFMDESLVLLRHLLCWTPHDVVSFTMNARREEVKPPLDPELLSALRELNSADVLLYDHFLAKHRRAVLEFGLDKMAEEVSELRALQDEHFDSCGTREVEVYSGMVNVYFASNKAEQDCVMMTLPELPLTNAARKHQQALLKSLDNKTSEVRPRS
ncbi:galactosylceramide sulfotransferase-like [Macrobrachium nipponense]|uniref:galactosylceramide sulfotransferase-like n=1 Tax=Macrobrachium nipponense TaxID=159736 RepID=UPI0030C84457